ncbi:lipid A export permease/ATP-binding protein MsbA [Gammaproteobacteria bacterium]|nr:lipid A export permease/ATP-binding protein MsbA [Gammaproteobacteria bacterium]
MNQNKNHGYLLYKRLLKRTKVYKGVFILAILGMILHALADTSFAALIKPLLDGSFVNQDEDVISLMPTLIILIFIFRGIGSFMSNYGMAFVGRSIIRDIRKDMFDKIILKSSESYDESITGRLVSKITFDAEQVAEAATKAITVIIKDGLTIIGLLSLMFYYSVELSIGLLLVAPIIGYFLKIMSIKFRSISRDIQKSMGEITNVVEESIIGHRLIKIFGGHKYETKIFDNVNQNNRERNLKLIFIQSLSIPLMQLVIAIFAASIIYFVISADYLEQISIGTFMSYLTAMIMLFAPIKRLSEVNVILQRGIAASESIFTLLDSSYESYDTTTYQPVDSLAINFKNINFKYASSADYILKNVTLSIKPGETVALVGKSGSGKTTILDLIPRLYEPSTGTINFNNEDIAKMDLNFIRKQISYVGQDFTLFNDTVYNNIAYGELNENSKNEIENATKKANAFDFINLLPNKFDTYVGQNGVLLSGGQRQRIAIARAILKNSPILLLDEATSALDSESESVIQESINNLSTNKTTLIIAHRLSTVINADKIVVIENGQVIEQGNHRELLNNEGAYSVLYNSQFKN